MTLVPPSDIFDHLKEHAPKRRPFTLEGHIRESGKDALLFDFGNYDGSDTNWHPIPMSIIDNVEVLFAPQDLPPLVKLHFNDSNSPFLNLLRQCLSQFHEPDPPVETTDASILDALIAERDADLAKHDREPPERQGPEVQIWCTHWIHGFSDKLIWSKCGYWRDMTAHDLATMQFQISFHGHREHIRKHLGRSWPCSIN